MPTKPRFEASPDIDKCCDHLRKHRDKGLITYASLSAALGRDITGKDRYVLQSARRKLERENIIFVVETGKGIRRADDVQVARLSTDEPIEKTRRIVRTARKRQNGVNVQNLSGEQRTSFYTGRAVIGAIGQATRKHFRNKLEEAVNTSDGPLPISRTLELFKKVRPRKATAV